MKNIEKKCHDCGKEIEIENNDIKNGVLLSYKTQDNKEIEVFKCNDCFERNRGLSNFQVCEVYSRVVGYLRPVQQWNEGKIREFQERENFKI